MAFVPVPDVIEAEVVWEWDGQVVENTLYFLNDSGWSAGSILEHLEDLRDVIVSQLIPLLPSSIQLVRLVGTLLDAVDAVSVTLSVSPAVVGGVALESVPSNVSYAIQFKTDLRGRSFRGRNYIPGIPNDKINTNTITSGDRTSFTAAYEAISAVGVDLGRRHVVVSRFSAGAPRTIGLATPVTAIATADATVDSQRRRLPGRGR